MLYTDEERAIMAEALQPNMRSANIPQTAFAQIIADHLADFRFEGARVLDIGPGQLDFLDIARDRGAAQTVGVDFDPAIVALGKLRGHDIRLANLRQGWPCPDARFDLIFCRGSLNCHWFPAEPRLRAFLDGLAGSLAPGGRMWIAPWNKPARDDPAQIEAVTRVLADWAGRHGIAIRVPDPKLHARYGIGYGIPQVTTWTR